MDLASTTGIEALRQALMRSPICADLPVDALRPLPTTGLAHDHVRIGDTAWLLRAPKQSQMGFSALDNLAYQATCFQRASPSGHAPRLKGVVAPQAHLPMGALVVEFIDGKPLAMPGELRGIALALAAIHSVPTPRQADRPPIRDSTDAVAAEMELIQTQAKFLPDADLRTDALNQLREEMHWAERFAALRAGKFQPFSLIASDTHPGNWLLRNEDAILVDWEKGQYGSPGVDLAHASIYTSTTWDLVAAGAPTLDSVAGFYRDWLDNVAQDLAQATRPWLLPMRRLVWLRAITWCIKWRVVSRGSLNRSKGTGESAEDWSAENSDPALVAHVRDRVDHYLAPETMRRVRREWAPGSPLYDL